MNEFTVNPADVSLESMSLGKCTRAEAAFIGTFTGMSSIVLCQRVSSGESLATGVTKVNVVSVYDK